MRAVLVVSVACSFSILAGCSGHDDGGGSVTDAATNDGTPIVVGDGATHDAAPIDAGPKLCWIGHSTDTSSSTCDECSQVACADRWSATWGAGWSKDEFTGGACAKDATCLCTCDEEDLVCRENCDINLQDVPCRDAKQALYDCETAQCAKPCGRSF